MTVSFEKQNTRIMKTINNSVLILFAFLTLSACGGGEGTESNQDNTATAASTEYAGPAPTSSDVQSFKLAVWDNLKSNNRCGNCHYAGGQEPMFVRADDINLAYSSALQIVSLASPADSRMVTKVAEGHNCWDELEVCRSVLTAYITNWAGNTSTSARTIQLSDPTIRDPGESKSFPTASTNFSSLHTLLANHCSSCHTESSATPQSPYFATTDIDVAYEAAKSKIDLDTPTNSRLVVRVRDEFHNCWSGSCSSDAGELLTAINTLSNSITPDSVDSDLVVSKALFMGDGIVASGGSRHEANQIALYEFKRLGDDFTAYDTSGVEPALNLSLSGEINWLDNYGIQIVSGMAKGTTQASKKLHDMIKNTGEYSIEAWVIPANVTQEGPARIISYSGSTSSRNFTLGQTLYNYNYLHRSDTTSSNGEPDLSTADADEDLQATLQHVVVTFDPINGRRIYVDGEFTDDIDTAAAGNLNDWDDSFALILGNEASSDRQWQGSLRMVAIHNRALTQAQISQNFEIGVGRNLYMLFSVSDLVDMPRSYIMFEMSLLDNYSFLFNKPTFINLDGNTPADNKVVQGIRLGINGKEATVGQAYLKVDDIISSSNQVLANIGTIVALEKGIDSDEFFLTFDRIGAHTNAMSRAVTYTATPLPDPAASSEISIRTFDEINATMAEVTGVDPQTLNVFDTYNTIKQQLPAVENIEGFVSAHQVAITQLAFAYCSALVDDTSLRAGYFSGFDFTADVATAFSLANTTLKNQTIDNLTSALYNRMITNNLNTAPLEADIRSELSNTTDANSDGVGDGLFEQLTQSCPGGADCQAARTQTVVKGMCAAVLGSASMLLQ